MRTSRLACLWLVLAGLAGHASAACPVGTPVQGAAPGVPLPVFPATNWWNLDIHAAPVDPNSTAYINWIGATRGLHPDFGGVDLDLGDPYVYGFPYAVVDGSQAKLPVTFEVWDESDGVNMSTGAGVPFYPIPAGAITQSHWVEGGPAGNVDLRADNDRHLLVLDCTNNDLYELYNVWYDGVAHQWHAYSGAFFDLDRNDRRPDTWTSADASGMALFPGLVRYDEAANGALTDLGHALRVTTRDTNGYVFPASHDAGNGAGAPPLGTRLRLKAMVNGQDPVLRTADPMARRIFRTMQKYGLIVADNGSDMYISGTFDTRWNNDTLNPAFSLLKASDFEVIQLGWNPPTTPTLSIADLGLAEGNSGTKLLTFTVTLSQAAGTTVTFNAATANGTATAGSDYVALSATGLSIPAGQLTKTFSVTVNGDTAIEGDETLLVNLSSPSGAVLGDAQATGTIANDDGLRISDAATTEGHSGTKVLTFTVSLPQALGAPVNFSARTQGVTATSGTDFVALPLTAFSIPAGQLTRTVDVTINGDVAIEANETFVVNLSAVSGAPLLDGQGTGTINNDDFKGLRINDVATSEGNAGTKLLTFTVSLAQPLANAVTFNANSQSGTATVGSDFVGLPVTPFSIPAGQLTTPVSITINGDTTIEGNETLLVNLSSASGAPLLDGQGIGTINNDDLNGLRINDVATPEGNAGTKLLTFTVSLVQPLATTVTFNANSQSSTATVGSDFVGLPVSPFSIPAGQVSTPVSITIKGDTTVEGNETLLVNLSSASGAPLLDGQGVGTITNDD
jgi:hypothetical protein